MDLSPGLNPLAWTPASDTLEATRGRLCEIRALLQSIDAGGLLASLPPPGPERELHRIGVSLLEVMSRELAALIRELDRATDASMPPPVN